MDPLDRPAAHLEGVELDGGWIVGERIDHPGSTGSNFSFGYTVTHPSRGSAFLKALDYSRALRAEDVPSALKAMTDAYVYERDLLERCTKARLSKVVLPLAHGQVSVPTYQIPVNYLIFERADGDVRKFLNEIASIDDAWAMRVLHNTAIGVQQLHGEKIAHQDVKPSNLLTFGSTGSSKIGDLGRAEYQGAAGPHVDLRVAGDPGYAPPEQLYGLRPDSWGARRQACDLYHLGSMVLFFFLGTAATPALLARMDPIQHPNSWGDSYEAVLPFVRSAFNEVAEELSAVLPDFCREKLTTAFRELCDPEPALRGHPKARERRHSNPYSVDRYVSLFNLLALRAETKMRGAGG